MAWSRKKAEDQHRAVTESNRREARRLAQQMGGDRVVSLLQDAHEELAGRLEASRHLGPQSFTQTQLRAVMKQVKVTTQGLVGDMRDDMLDAADDVGEAAGQDVLDEMASGSEQFHGLEIGSLGLDTASVLDAASYGANASVARRIAGEEHDGIREPGVLARYGVATVGSFEDILRKAVIANMSGEDVKALLVDASPFLQGQPSFWAERLYRTEMMGAHNRALWEGQRDVDDQLTDGGEEPEEGLIKILSATFDERTGWDSYAVHGQVRRLEEPFQWNTARGGSEYYMTPPNRPNDREVVVSWRKSWGAIPKELRPVDADKYIAAFRRQYSKKISPPPRPLMSTVEWAK